MNCPQCADRMSPYRPGWSICYGCAVLASAEGHLARAGSADRASRSASAFRRDGDAPAVPSLGRLEEADDVAVGVTHGGHESALAYASYVLQGLDAGLEEDY